MTPTELEKVRDKIKSLGCSDGVKDPSCGYRGTVKLEEKK